MGRIVDQPGCRFVPDAGTPTTVRPARWIPDVANRPEPDRDDRGEHPGGRVERRQARHSATRNPPRPFGSSSASDSVIRLRIRIASRSGRAARRSVHTRRPFLDQLRDVEPLQELRLRTDRVGLRQLIERHLGGDVLGPDGSVGSGRHVRCGGRYAASHATDASTARRFVRRRSRSRATTPTAGVPGHRPPMPPPGRPTGRALRTTRSTRVRTATDRRRR